MPHPCDTCAAPATVQWARLATDAEAAARTAELTEQLGHPPTARYLETCHGPARAVVFGCAEHDLSPAPADGSAEAAAAARQAGLERRALVHAANCPGHGKCQRTQEGSQCTG